MKSENKDKLDYQVSKKSSFQELAIKAEDKQEAKIKLPRIQIGQHFFSGGVTSVATEGSEKGPEVTTGTF